MKSNVLRIAVLVLVASVVVAQDMGRLRFKKTVSFDVDTVIELEAQVGPVRVDTVMFSEEGSSGKKRKLFSKRALKDPEVYTGMSAEFECENPSKDEWDVKFTIDFLDKNGELIDRMSDKKSFEGEAKTIDFDHTTLSYVIQYIDSVKITLEAELD